MGRGQHERLSADGGEHQLGRGLVIVGIAVAIWWPCFTLGAWGTLFFDQLLTVWVAATAAVVVVLTQVRGRRRWRQVAALLIPSVWLAVALIPDGDGDSVLGVIADIFGVVLGLVGLPFTAGALVRVLWPQLLSDFGRRSRVIVIGALVVIAAASYLLGVFQDQYLTCADFEISGNSAPPGCTTPTPTPMP